MTALRAAAWERDVRAAVWYSSRREWMVEASTSQSGRPSSDLCNKSPSRTPQGFPRGFLGLEAIALTTSGVYCGARWAQSPSSQTVRILRRNLFSSQSAKWQGRRSVISTEAARDHSSLSAAWGRNEEGTWTLLQGGRWTALWRAGPRASHRRRFVIPESWPAQKTTLPRTSATLGRRPGVRLRRWGRRIQSAERRSADGGSAMPGPRGGGPRWCSAPLECSTARRATKGG